MTTLPSMKPLAYTHSGDFHVDELVALALLQTFAFPGRPMEVVRTRNPQKLTQAMVDPEVFVVDVGREYNPQALNFDHHQITMEAGWPDGTLYSSCGLVWHWLKEHGLLYGLAPEAQAIIEKDLIHPIDTHDNGGAKWPQAMLFRLYNRTGNDVALVNAQFEKALAMAQDLVTNQVNQAQLEHRAEIAMAKFWEESQQLNGRGIVVVRANLETRAAASVLSRVSDYQANLMVFPQGVNRNNRTWFVRALAPAANSHETRCPFPTEWRGAEGATLDAQGHPVNVAFVHKSGFLARVEGSLDDALALANAVLDHPENQHALMLTANAGPKPPKPR